MKKIDAWLLTEGAHGMISQVEGLAKSLDANYQHKKLLIINFGAYFLQGSPLKTNLFLIAMK